MSNSGSGFGSFFGSVNNNFGVLAKQVDASGKLDGLGHPQDINSVGRSVGGGGENVSKILRKKILKSMSKKMVKQNGGRMKKVFKIDGIAYKCEATKVGKHCRYHVLMI